MGEQEEGPGRPDSLFARIHGRAVASEEQSGFVVAGGGSGASKTVITHPPTK